MLLLHSTGYAVSDELILPLYLPIDCTRCFSGTLFTLGSAGGLSISLALRGIMENLVGGVAIKLQDKLRVGERISIPDSQELGEVLSVGYSSTRVRLDDDSVMEIPNQTFINRQVVNWSRTPYRLFRTSCSLQGGDLLRLPLFVSMLRKELSALPGTVCSGVA